MIIVFLSAIIRITASLMPQRFAVSTCASLSTTALTLFAIIRGHSLLLLSTVVVIVSRVVIISVFLVADAVCHRVVATVVVVTIICGFGHGSFTIFSTCVVRSIIICTLLLLLRRVRRYLSYYCWCTTRVLLELGFCCC